MVGRDNFSPCEAKQRKFYGWLWGRAGHHQVEGLWMKEDNTLEKAVWENVMVIAVLDLGLWEETRRLPHKINIT